MKIYLIFDNKGCFMRKAVLACAVGFGLGPAGKLSSIVLHNQKYTWYACGDELDMGIYEKFPYRDVCWSSDENILKAFISRYDIKNAVVVLDPIMAIMLKKIGLRVIYVDSLPFLWTKADILPCDVHIYCAQKFPSYEKHQSQVLKSVKNLVWVNPIVLTDIPEKDKTHYVVINFGGLHSPVGDGKAYVRLILPALLEAVRSLDIIHIYITGGKNAVVQIKELLSQYQVAINGSLVVKTFPHWEFLSLVSGADYFFTSPGLTTVFETCAMNVKTFILPPQNLSQFFNAMTARQVYRMVKIMDWDQYTLTKEYLFLFKEAPEEQVVSFIYGQIEKLAADHQYRERIRQDIAITVRNEFGINPKQDYSFSPTGVKEIAALMDHLFGGET
jgi:hydroxymethylcytosylglucuronate/cytosylglucuronate synthase